MKKEKNNIGIIDFIYTISLKNQLINAPSSFLIENYNNIDDYVSLLENLDLIIKNEDTFFLLDENIYRKAIDILDAGKKFNNKELNYLINGIINELNIIHGIRSNEKNNKINEYIKSQQKIRNIKIKKNKQLLKALAYDGIILSYIINDLESDNINLELSISSINYLVEYKPKLFKTKEYKEKAISILEKGSKKSDIFNKINTKRAIYKVKKEVII